MWVERIIWSVWMELEQTCSNLSFQSTGGTYTMVVSSFYPGADARFSVKLGCDMPIKVSTIPQEGAGMFKRIVLGVW